MNNYDITLFFQLGMNHKDVDCFPLRSFSLSAEELEAAGTVCHCRSVLRAQIQCDRSVGNN